MADAAHPDGVAEVVLWLSVILLTAKIGGDLAARLKQPPVLGEIVLGIVVGNLRLVGISGLDPIATDASIDLLAQIGVLILLFEVGLTATVGQMLTVGRSSAFVAVLGV